MKKIYVLVFSFIALALGKPSHAQIVGTDVFLQGQWLEVGVDQMGAFGTCSSPGTYHVHGCCGVTTCITAGSAMDASYDWGHDGWTVGTPCLMGPYTIPGFPQEGWSIEAAGTEYRNWASGGICTGSFAIPGSITGYTNSGGSATGTFTGNIVGLHIVQDTRVDTFGSWAIVTTRIYNTTLAPITGVYYERTCDPDNASYWDGGSTTENVILHQNEDSRHAVEIGTYAVGPTFTTPAITMDQYNSWLGLGTKDCRAKCGVIPGLSPSNTPSQLWSGTGTVITALNDSNYEDEGIFLVFNIGTIPANDSAVVSYAYIYSGRASFDSALPDPQLVVGGVPVPTAFPPAATIDTYNTCIDPLALTVPVYFNYATDRDWTWSKWTWTPSIGLATTTGTINTINVLALTGPTTYTITGTDTSAGTMVDCNVRTFILTVIPCHHAVNNSPCFGDTLRIWDYGDSLGATYAWTGPGGFRSTQQYITIHPATFADSGMYRIIKTVAGIHDTDSTYVTIHPKPVTTVTNNGPLCQGAYATLLLTATPASPGEIFTWTGPDLFTSSLQNPSVDSFSTPDVGIYKMIATTVYGCKDTEYTNATMIPPPRPPIVTDGFMCQNGPFTPYTIDSVAAGGTVLWYPGPTGGVGSTTPTPIIMSTAQHTLVYFSQKVGGCESARSSALIIVTTQPLAPGVSGRQDYCQYVGPMDTLTVTPNDSVLWYTAVTGGVGVRSEPLPLISDPITTNFWVTQTDSGCESPRTPYSVTVHRKPLPPNVTLTPYCQYKPAGPLQATASGTGDVLLWYGPGMTIGSTTAPTPGTSIAPDTVLYWVTETSSFGCVSDPQNDPQITKIKPPLPVTGKTKYCQGAGAAPMNLLVDSMPNSHLNWYYNTLAVGNPPIPPTNVPPGVYTWYVSQTINGCEGDSTTVPVTIIWKPVFGITASNSFVCDHDTLTFSYYGPVLPPLGAYTWTLPQGATAIDRTTVFDSTIIVQFDSANQNNYVSLMASDDSAFCSSDTTIRINVIALPFISASTKPDVCVGDTVQLGLSYMNNNAHDFTWYIDNIIMSNSQSISTIASSSNSSGPFEISWVDSGRHVILVTSVTEEGCKSNSAFDSVFVRPIPDASFRVTDSLGCIGDSVQFVASTANYNYSYVWAPAHYFNNLNSPVISGTLDNQRSFVTLTVTDPFGCSATSTQEVDPHSCCSIEFPNAFTPNGDLKNDFFRPVPGSGYHNLHKFVIVNRWGVEVFNGGNTNQQWDGNLDGVPQDMGVYFYYVKYDCGGSTFEQKGDVTLIR